MKKSNFILIVFISLALFSCKKYPDGPTFSIRSKAERLANSWHMQTWYQNGYDKTSDFNNWFKSYVMTITKDGNYTATYAAWGLINVSEIGTWKFSSDKTKALFTVTKTGKITEWTILKLEEKELWAKYVDSSNNDEAHLIP